jgi:hypothetical protein
MFCRMKISPDQISQFQSIYKNAFGEDISQQAAHDQAMYLIRLVTLIYTPMQREEYERVKKEIPKIQERINKKNKVC